MCVNADSIAFTQVDLVEALSDLITKRGQAIPGGYTLVGTSSRRRSRASRSQPCARRPCDRI